MAKDKCDTPAAPAKANRPQKRSQRTRQAIILAASDIFLHNGVANTTVTDITEAAQVGYGTFYHHFHSLDDVVSAVAEATMRKMVSIAASIVPEALRFELAPAVCARIFIRYFFQDSAVRCLLERPYVFVDEWHKAVTPFVSGIALKASSEGPEGYAGAIDYRTAMRIGPWLMISELNHAVELGSAAPLEDDLANLFTRMIGVDPERRAELVEQSRRIMDQTPLPPVANAPSARPR